MTNSYADLVKQTCEFPQHGFELHDGNLHFNGIDLKEVIEQHGSPLKVTYLPRIRSQIQKARALFNDAIDAFNYDGRYEFCYCTKCSHFRHVVSTALKEKVSLETSSGFDIDLIRSLYERGEISKDITIVHNGYKTAGYLKKIEGLLQAGFSNIIVVLDNMEELAQLEALEVSAPIDIGIRMCINEEPKAQYYTSRMGINRSKIRKFVKERIVGNNAVSLKMMHFFIDSGIRDNFYYWGEFQRALETYIKLKKLVPALDALNIGGGFPFRNSLDFEYDFEFVTREIVSTIKKGCKSAGVDEPDIFTEFGKYTVAESAAVIFKVLQQKQQNNAERWYIIDNSLMNTIPDAWSMDEKFILLPLNKWNKKHRRVNIGGISCDHSDFYNSQLHDQPVMMPEIDDDDKEPLYLGFFHTGAYQEAISGYGGIKHCLIPSPKNVVFDRDTDGTLHSYVYRNEQDVNHMLSILGYND